MERPKLLLLTDLSNGAEAEDVMISNYLRRRFQVFVAHPADCEPIEDLADVILVRNTWNEADYGKPSPGHYERFRAKNLNVHHDMYELAGGEKDYLVELYRQGSPVIPTVNSIDELSSLPASENYFIKPQDGFDAIGAEKISRSELIGRRLQGFLIQPFIDFEYEVSFYYLDKAFQYALYAPDRSKRWDLERFEPSEEDMHFAKGFVDSNKQRFGIERIDACRLKDGRLLLMEITDRGGVYLSLPRLDEITREMFLEKLGDSLMRRVLSRSKA